MAASGRSRHGYFTYASNHQCHAETSRLQDWEDKRTASFYFLLIIEITS